VAHHAFLRDSVRSAIQSCWKRRPRLNIVRIDLGNQNRHLVLAKLPLDGLAEVLQKMKAIGDLPRLRRALTRSFRVEASKVAPDHLHFRMILGLDLPLESGGLF
jgi:hypothetical protein